VSYQQTGVRREAFAAIIRREGARRGSGQMLSQFPGPGAYAATLADEIVASGLMSHAGAYGRLKFILQGGDGIVSLDVADKILTALDLNHLWHTELADEVVVPNCPKCGVVTYEYSPGCDRCTQRKYWRTRREHDLRRDELAAQTAPPPPSARPASRSGGATPSTKERQAA
jgi:hypothetical protein